MSDRPANSAESFVTRIERYAEDTLRPAALQTDRTEVPADTVHQLAELGALNHLAPARFGGAGLGRDDDRRVHEVIAGACLNTWPVWAQHQALTVAAVEPDTRTVVTALVPVGERTRAAPLRLGVLTGSRTQRVRLDAVAVPDENVLGTQPLDEWRRADIGTTSDARPHHFGLAATVLGELATDSYLPARKVAAVWAPRVAQIRADAYGLADEAVAAGGGPHRLDERLALKVASGEALGTLTRALVAARSGHGIAAGDTAQLHARSALFVLVQGQSSAVREAQLSHFTT